MFLSLTSDARNFVLVDKHVQKIILKKPCKKKQFSHIVIQQCTVQTVPVVRFTWRQQSSADIHVFYISIWTFNACVVYASCSIVERQMKFNSWQWRYRWHTVQNKIPLNTLTVSRVCPHFMALRKAELGGAVVRTLDLRLEVAGSIPAAALLSASRCHAHAFASITKQYYLVPAWTGE